MINIKEYSKKVKKEANDRKQELDKLQNNILNNLLNQLMPFIKSKIDSIIKYEIKERYSERDYEYAESFDITFDAKDILTDVINEHVKNDKDMYALFLSYGKKYNKLVNQFLKNDSFKHFLTKNTHISIYQYLKTIKGLKPDSAWLMDDTLVTVHVEDSVLD